MKQKKVIVNADDCGMSAHVNEHIEKAILCHRITSTTVMANMDGFDGAVKLYKEYGKHISFGWHINLTEGHPLLANQLLIDTGYYVEDEQGGAAFNGKFFWRKKLSKEMKNAIRNELLAQYEKLRDNGIEISHADSHHHIHTSLPLMMFVPSLLEELHIGRMRRMRNYVPMSASYLLRQLVGGVISATHPILKIPGSFGGFMEYVNNPSYPSSYVTELECHPGHPNECFVEEENLLLSTDLKETRNVELISYYDF